ncbi:transposase subfamily [Verrucomicrobiia bacterium DG1235]|nr:transposase subfamily [Verrucomicrobiae bacterium DG1235]EDY83811.1 transposase subfamily [Verrucomicrobiae bacterium DG1235]EDY84792.1 transposase subfamily [Verrucomicrobiae bacterium DG1235]EDY85249.1 transposase subfamily [Verrucomicrobiae bacterium DG1235]
MSRGKGKRYKEEEIVRILRDAEGGTPVAEILRKHNISAGTFYRWRNQYAGMDAVHLRRLKELEAENAKLKRMVAERMLDIEALKEINSKNWSSP